MTAREPSAVEVVTDAMIVHRSVRGKTQFDADRCRTCGIEVMYRHGAEEVLAALKAAGFVVATRDEISAMTPQQQAELIGGDVVKRPFKDDAAVNGYVWCEYARGLWREVDA